MDRLKQLQHLFDDDPNDPFLFFAIAKEYENLDQLDNALSKYEALFSQFPDYIGLYYHYAKLLELLDRKEDALTKYDEGIKVAKKAADFHALSELNNAKLNCELD